MPNSNTSNPTEPEVENDYSIARHRPRRVIRRPALYVGGEDSGLLTYVLAVIEETLKGIEPSYLEAVSCLNFSSWLLVCKKKCRVCIRIASGSLSAI